MINHLNSTDGRVYLTDTTLLQNDFLLSQPSRNEVFMIKMFRLGVGKNCFKLLELFVHRNDDSYFHTAKVRKSYKLNIVSS